jgi:hypothetical protein
MVKTLADLFTKNWDIFHTAHTYTYTYLHTRIINANY